MRKATIYLRVSTKEQGKSGLGAEAQEHDCLGLVRKRGTAVGETYRDEGLSGDLPPHKRPGLLAAIAALKKGDILVVKRRDRICRGGSVAMSVIEQLIRQRGARLISASGEGTDSDSPEDIFFRDISDAVSRLELSKIRERTRDALAAKARRGESTGAPPFGWDLDEAGPRNDRGRPARLVENVSEQIALENIRLMIAEGKSSRAIARSLNQRGIATKRNQGLWRYSSVAKIMARLQAQHKDTEHAETATESE